jgi:hypothetical protein
MFYDFQAVGRIDRALRVGEDAYGPQRPGIEARTKNGRLRMSRFLTKRILVATVGGCLLAGVASTAALAEDQVGDDSSVDVSVDIAPITEPGSLTMTVAGSSAALTEAGSTASVRQFTGNLPTVTVTDTREADDVPDEAFWYVLGTVSSFIGDGGQDPITADHLGWTPALLTPSDNGEVVEGFRVDTSLDPAPNNTGLVDKELLAMANTSDEAIGSWQATAGLTLKVPVEIEGGNYSSTLTLSLFE